MKIIFTFSFVLICFQINSYSQGEKYIISDNVEKFDSIRFSNRSHYDSGSKDFVEKQFNKINKNKYSNNKVNKYQSSNINGSDEYIKIPLGREEISGWTIFSTEYNIWQIPLDLKPRIVLANGVSLIEMYDPDFDFLLDSSWHWENNILYLKNDDGNPDSTYSSIIAVNSGGWATTTGKFNNDNFTDIVYSAHFKTFVHYGGPEFSTKANKILEVQGFYLANAGDVNGDGYDELISSLNWGKDSVYIYSGSIVGLNEDNKILLLAPEGYNAYGYGHAISKNPGDINGDGFNDVLIGGAGYFCIYFGNTDGIDLQPDNIWEIPSPAPAGILNLSFIGDINNDGFDDIAASYTNNLPTTSITVYVFYGSPTGLNNSNYEIYNFPVNQTETYRSAKIGNCGDINNDGIDDLLIGNQWHNWGTGQAYIFYGSSSGLANSPDQIIDNPSAIQNSRFGNDLDGIGDFNNDGFNDIIIGSPYEGNNAYIYYGSNLGISSSPDITLTEGQFFGWSVSRAGDVFGDGRNYIVVGEEFGESYLITLLDSVIIPPNWQIKMYISDANNEYSRFVTLGQNEIATDNIDFLLGEEELPPPPPTGVFDVRFILPNSVSSIKDIRSIEKSDISWIIKFQPGSTGYPMTFNWNKAILPEGSFNLKDAITGDLVNVDMKAQNSFTLTNSAISLLYIEHRKQICTDISVNNRWNIISVPVEMSDMHPSNLFPNAVSFAFSYDNGYAATESLEVGKGYWLKFNNSEKIQFCGVPVYKNIEVKAGWNIIGPFDQDIPIDQITSLPEGIITSDFYGYYNGYSSTYTLQKGNGYWVKVSENGELKFVNNSLQISKEEIKKITNPMIAIPIYVNDGSSVDTLIVGIDPTASDSLDIHLGEAILPPLPPVGAFDVRLNIPNTQESSIKDFRFGPEADKFERIYQIQYQRGAGDKIVLTWDLPDGLSLRVQDVLTGSIVDETFNSGVDSITIANPDAVDKLNLIIIFPSSYIPVELTALDGTILENAVRLKWETATETNNKGFEIQRNLNSSWEKVGYVSGYGTSTNPQEYSFTDNFKYQFYKGTAIYRLKQIDYDGTCHYSNEIKLEIDFAPKEFTLYQNYPNPFNPSTKIKYTVPQESIVTIKVYDILGGEIETLVNEEKSIGFYDVNFNASNLASGIYIYQMQAGSFVSTKKFILMK